MAAVFAITKRRPDLREVHSTMTGDASYPAGGYPVVARDLGLLSIDSVECYVQSAQGLVAQFDSATSKIKLFVTGALDAVLNDAGAGDVSTSVIVRCIAKGDPIL